MWSVHAVALLTSAACTVEPGAKAEAEPCSITKYANLLYLSTHTQVSLLVHAKYCCLEAALFAASTSCMALAKSTQSHGSKESSDGKLLS